jgi:hypothetical protein
MIHLSSRTIPRHLLNSMYSHPSHRIMSDWSFEGAPAAVVVKVTEEGESEGEQGGVTTADEQRFGERGMVPLCQVVRSWHGILRQIRTNTPEPTHIEQYAKIRHPSPPYNPFPSQTTSKPSECYPFAPWFQDRIGSINRRSGGYGDREEGRVQRRGGRGTMADERILVSMESDRVGLVCFLEELRIIMINNRYTTRLT